jgi:valyl-tRNA synthetase
MPDMPKAYEPGLIEKKWYDFWLGGGYFTPAVDREKKPFVIVMPLPNVTGDLHVGHALFITLQDVMTRWHRMLGEPALWLPGTDHAGIATQVVIERRLAAQGKTKEEIGREAFTGLIWEWAEKNRADIRRQHQQLGASCDWTREKFTLDEGPSRAVRTAFVHLYHKGLIYRGERMVNWCPRCRTAISDLEVEHKDTVGHLYYIRYPLADGEGFITVATTRPETFLGDTAVAVNPSDERYKHLVGKCVVLPILNRTIPIVADDAVDAVFGTGALKITPAHDPTDLEIGQRHGFPLISVMNPDATMNENAGPYRGLDRLACRERVLADLEADGLIERTEPYSHAVGHCDRCQAMIEPTVSLQWFLRTQPLADAAIEAVRSGRITIIPERFTKLYFEWMENIRDWCISRQLWWGHRIPVWYCRECTQVTASIDEATACAHCGSEALVQDPDVLDTWFSSALWTHSPLGWPDDTEDLRYFYPSSVMETGYDILFFWVARMIMMGLENMGEVPFRTVYLHGLIRDTSGGKMSRTKLQANAMSPAEPIGVYGVDALRFSLTVGTTAGNDMGLGTDKLESGRNFVNKLWNASRFIIQCMHREGWDAHTAEAPLETVEDRWIMSQLNRLVADVDDLMRAFRFGEALQHIYEFIWSRFCDWYVEIAKARIRSQGKPSPLPFLFNSLDTSLRLLHPFMPFVTEELWQRLHGRPVDSVRSLQSPVGSTASPESLMVAPYPTADASAFDPGAERVMDAVIDIVRSIRNTRTQNKVAPDRWVEARVYAGELLPDLVTEAGMIETLARARPLHILSREQERPAEERAIVSVLKESEVVLPWAGMTDLSIQEERLRKEGAEIRSRIAHLDDRLNDASFLNKAPVEVVDKERQRLDALKDRLRRIDQELS